MTDTIWLPELPAGPRPKYLGLSDAIRRAVDEGTLPAGHRLPPVRDLGYRLGITPGTVARAYGILTDEGVLEAAVGRGTFVAPPRRAVLVDPPYLMVEPARDEARVNFRHAVVPDVGQVAAIRECLLEVAESAGEDLLRYPSRADDLPAVTALLRWLSETDIGPAWAEDVVLCSGAQHGVLIALQTLARGRRSVVLTEELSYPGFRNAAALVGAEVVGLEIDAHGIRPDSLEAALRRYGPAVLCTSAEAHNPTTICTPPERRAEIVALARAFDLHILDDDCFSVGRQRHPGYRALAPERGWHIASMSKSVSPALRFGGVIAPKGWGPRAILTAQHQNLGMSRPLSELCRRLMDSGRADRLRTAVRDVCAARVGVLREELGDQVMATREDVPFAWISLPRGWRASSFLRAADARDIQLRAADVFALIDGRAPNAVRLSLNGTMDEATFRGALQTLAAILAEPTSEVEV